MMGILDEVIHNHKLCSQAQKNITSGPGFKFPIRLYYYIMPGIISYLDVAFRVAIGIFKLHPNFVQTVEASMNIVLIFYSTQQT